MSTLYWITVLGDISTVAAFIFCMFAVFGFVSSFEFFEDDFDDEGTKSRKKNFKIWFIGELVSLALCILIPSKKDLYAIYGVGSVIDYAKSSKESQKLPDNAVKALNAYLENIQKEDSTNTEK